MFFEPFHVTRILETWNFLLVLFYDSDVLNGAKRLNDWNAWNGLIPVMNGAKRWNVWNNWNFGTLGTSVCLKRFELSEAVERLERLELASA
jgi:hypothetical protein